MHSESMFNLFYFIFSFCMIFPMPVFELCGLSVEALLSKWLKTEEESFIIYHMRRIVATIIFHSSLPLGYFLVRIYMNAELIYSTSIVWQFLLIASLTLPFVAIIQMYSWMKDDWRSHCVSSKLAVFSQQNFRQVAKDIDLEYKGPIKIVIKCNPTSKVVATANWIVKTTRYSLDVAHQSDVSLTVVSSDEHQIAPESPGGVQYLQILVTSTRPGVKPFTLRINASDFQILQDAITRPIRVMENVHINVTLTDRFLVAFREQVLKNPDVEIEQQIEDDCWGCSVKKPNVKLIKTCGDGSSPESCKECYCRAMWCLDCMGTWFASRQDPEKPDEWMSSKCPCPICRSLFCVLDVCLIREVSENQ